MLYAGCAADVLFFPELIGRAARLRSCDPITGQTVSLSLEADGSVRDLQPATTVLSMAVPTTTIEAVAIPEACGPINLFGSRESGHEFTHPNPGKRSCSPSTKASSSPTASTIAYGSAIGDRKDPRQ